ncbi:MAG: hypothetical protein QXF56_05170 [Candidatus Micrarchaeia archaeon]
MSAKRRKQIRERCGGAITIATEGAVIQVASDSLEDSERIAMTLMNHLKQGKQASHSTDHI